uniref:Uncharacterized protein n=1 Tax=Candidatus Kentrum sp. LPFa TaxID=2126335 RepID=A0A450WDG4_9GAMM|nr:MAG: hypothetical protein BECKLPF1236A_GA0070988_101205 [Candidatus Kentron sp. LPFa]VFK30984.1 MAG: hypothetical protein BECKLPF1236C_GA0070990_101255 [Candidatus Kentron sp. LPFa]
MSNLVLSAQIRGDAAQLVGELNRVDSAVVRVGSDSLRAGRDMGTMESEAQGLDTTAKSLVGSLKNIALAAATGFGIKETASSFLEAKTTAEGYATRLEILLRSTSEGNRVFKAMAEYGGRGASNITKSWDRLPNWLGY